jgi:hypothetical protein
MRKKHVVAGHAWDFDGKTITVHIPMAWKRHWGRKVIIAPDGAMPGRRPNRGPTRR